MWNYNAELVRVVDGDTVYLKLSKEYDFGFKIKEVKTYEGSFRLIGIDTPELRGKNADKIKGRAASERLYELLTTCDKITATTFKPDSFGRWLVELFIHENDNIVNINELLVKEGHAVIYKR